MGICSGNARIAGSNEKNCWIVFFSFFPHILYWNLGPFPRLRMGNSQSHVSVTYEWGI